ncbi:MAG TPA: hypothetical protein VGH40_14270 [Roseiarcus sp.]|jgi:hypothetical protein
MNELSNISATASETIERRDVTVSLMARAAGSLPQAPDHVYAAFFGAPHTIEGADRT